MGSGGLKGTGDTTIAGELARFLKQRAELGGGQLFMEGLSREEALRAIRAVRDGLPVEVRGASGRSTSRPDPRPATSAGPEGEPEVVAGSGPESEEAEKAVREGREGEKTVGTFDYETLQRVASGCERCRLAEERQQVVFADGDPDARLMVVGEAPGAREDRTGLPFVGPAGKLLDLLLQAVDLSREDSAYICNVIKCRPPGNRNPLPDEIESCAPFLRRQIELVSPRAILAVGTFAGQLLTGRSSTLGNLRGEVYSYEGVPLVVTYHPAALLRNRSWTRSTWDDLQLLRQVLDGG